MLFARPSFGLVLHLKMRHVALGHGPPLTALKPTEPSGFLLDSAFVPEGFPLWVVCVASAKTRHTQLALKGRVANPLGVGEVSARGFLQVFGGRAQKRKCIGKLAALAKVTL